MPIYAEKNMRYSHFAEMREKCGTREICGNHIFPKRMNREDAVDRSKWRKIVKDVR